MKDAVRDRYASVARSLPEGDRPSLGVGDPVSLAALRPGETVLDLGSGPGHDLYRAAEAVGSEGRAIGVDMTPEMIERSRAGAPANVSVLEGELERLPLPCASVDVVISNCVINLVEDKRRALVEAYRALVPGGRLAVVDTAFDAEPAPEVRRDAEAWSCCVGGALVADDYVRLLEEIGFVDVRLERLDASCASDETCVGSVGVRAAKPGDRPEDVVRPAVPADLREGLPASGFRVEDALVVPGRGVVALERFGRSAMLRSLAVTPSERRRGHGRRLVIAALEVARWSGAEEVFLLTPQGTVGFFEPFGFRPVSRKRAGMACASEQFADAACTDAVAMRLSFEEADLPLLGRPSRKELPTFQGGACC